MFTIAIVSPEAKAVHASRIPSRAWAVAQAETLASTLDSDHVVQVVGRDGLSVWFTGRA